MVTRDSLKHLEEAQIITADQATAIESFFWQESHEGEHAHTRPFVRFLLELGTSFLLLGLILGAFLWMGSIPAWQGALISLVAGLLFGSFGILLKRTAFHEASPLLLLGTSLLIPLILFRLYDALAPVLVNMGMWLPLTQSGNLVLFGIMLVSFALQFAFFSCIKSKILSLPVALSWIYLAWLFGFYIQSNFQDLTYIVPAPNLALIVIIFGGMLLTVWGLLFNTPDPSSTGIWPEFVGLAVTSSLLALMMSNLQFLTAALPAQALYLGAAILFGVAGMYIFARTQRVVWGVFSSLFLLLSIFSAWTVLSAGAMSASLVLLGIGVALMGLAAAWHFTHK